MEQWFSEASKNIAQRMMQGWPSTLPSIRIMLEISNLHPKDAFWTMFQHWAEGAIDVHLYNNID